MMGIEGAHHGHRLMARCDVHRDPAGSGYLLDCQADVLAELNIRFVVQLLPAEKAPAPTFPRFNPALDIAGKSHVMQTQRAAAVSLSRLGPVVTSLKQQDYIVSSALDTLLTGI